MRGLGQSQQIFPRALPFQSLLQNPENQFPQSQSYVNVVSFVGCITLLGLGEWVPSQTQTVGHCLALLLALPCGAKGIAKSTWQHTGAQSMALDGFWCKQALL